ncbi:MAG TPA: hypothetical protein VFV31_12315 [Chitinophagaceae bacterium]|nr:hypothetical protein [Chitinophagaceae bacterium]
MKKVAIAGLLFVAACTKPEKTEIPSLVSDQKIPSTTQAKPELCTFGIKDFNLSKRAFIQEPVITDRRVTGGSGTTQGPVILLDFDGQLVRGTSWNYAGDINCAPANLTTTAINEIIQRVSIDYSPFNVTVTTNETVYNNAPQYKRMRVIITETWEWYGQAGGVSYINSFTWGDNTPCFVFSSLLNYNTKNIAEAASHEAGHTIGLYHQSRYDANCLKLSDYNSGAGTGELSWAPIMGVGYYSNVTLWHNGANPYGCSNFQNDIGIITNVVGAKTDDYANTTGSAATLSSQLSGIINSSADTDVFKVSFTSAKTINLAPVAAGAANNGGNLDLLLTVYNSQGTLLFTVDNASSLNASTLLNAGTYFVAASVVPNANATTYGMLGNYTISVL